MKPDPAIQAIRDVRHQISAAVGHDPYKLVEHYQQRQREREVAGQTRSERKPNDSHKQDDAA